MTTKSETETGSTDNGTESETDSGADSTTETTGSETETEDGDGDESTEEDGRLKKLRSDLNTRDSTIAELRSKLQEHERANLSETEKVTAERDDLKTENVDLRRQLVAARYGLDDDIASRLRGDTVEELEEDAQSLAEKFGKPETKTPPPPGEVGLGGKSGDEPSTDPVAAHRAAMARNRI